MLICTRLSRISNLVTTYKVLGGGSREPTPLAAAKIGPARQASR